MERLISQIIFDAIIDRAFTLTKEIYSLQNPFTDTDTNMKEKILLFFNSFLNSETNFDYFFNWFALK